MARTILITGGSGFVGQWLARALLARGDTVASISRHGAPRAGLLTEAERSTVRWISLDMLSEDAVRAAVESVAPAWVVHLAGIAFAPDANASPARALEVNALGAARLLSALAPAARSGVRTLVIGSAEQYGPHAAREYPLAEDAALHPLTAYAVAKTAQELIALHVFQSTGLAVVCTRSFNHSGVGHGDRYLLPSLVRRSLDLPKTGGALRIGNSTPVRDYLHVTDVVDAYIALLEKGVSGEVYNVSSGKGRTVGEIAELVLRRAGVSATVAADSSLARPSDVPLVIGDNTKLRLTTGWTPHRSIEDIIDDLIHAASR
jgi:GDP-4-dehydro-6-deoxy-D-mannose reductase